MRTSKRKTNKNKNKGRPPGGQKHVKKFNNHNGRLSLW